MQSFLVIGIQQSKTKLSFYFNKPKLLLEKIWKQYFIKQWNLIMAGAAGAL